MRALTLFLKAFFFLFPPQLEVLKIDFFFPSCFDLVLVLNAEMVTVEQLKPTQPLISNVM